MFQTKIAAILKALMPQNQEELSILQSLMSTAQKRQAGLYARKELSSAFLQIGESVPEVQTYFHGLVEALEIYQSIHGCSVPVQQIRLGDPLLYELRQIRDFCLQEGLCSIY